MKSITTFSHDCLKLLVLGASIVLVGGCGGEPKQHHVSGQVLFDGKPIPVGEIFFNPDATKKHDGPQGYAHIQDGHYDTRNGGQPVAPGPHVVRILGFDGHSRPDLELPAGKPLFPAHHTSIDVPDRETTLDFQVPGRGQSR